MMDFRSMSRRFAASALAGAVLFFSGYAAAANKLITIGTAGVTGVYFPAGGAVCRLVNTGRKEHGIKCTVESTEGSVFNISAIRTHELDVGVVQSDWQYQALNGTGPFEKDGPFKGLRSVFSMHSEPFTVLARADSGIAKFEDLKGKRVNVGNIGSGQRATMEVVMRALDWKMSDFARALELNSPDQGQALCDNQVDAIVYTAGHPNGAIQEVTSACDTRLVPIDASLIEKLVEANPYYALTVIPGRMYKGSDSDTQTFGVKATFVSSEDVDSDLIYQLVKAVFDRFEDFRTLHPVFSTLDPVLMVLDGNSAPLHPGALRYFRETGLYDKAVVRREEVQRKLSAAVRREQDQASGETDRSGPNS